jgi:micrococcal nuclease
MSLPLYRYRARVERVLDGDSLELTLDLGFYLTTRQRFRLRGYNAPESTGPERQLGQRARAALLDVLVAPPLLVRGLGQLYVATEKTDSFGRWLADVWIGDVNVVEQLLAQGWGVAWDGRGKRPVFDPTLPYPLGSHALTGASS